MSSAVALLAMVAMVGLGLANEQGLPRVPTSAERRLRGAGAAGGNITTSLTQDQSVMESFTVPAPVPGDQPATGNSTTVPVPAPRDQPSMWNSSLGTSNHSTGCKNYPDGPWFQSARNFYVVLSASLGDVNGNWVSASVLIMPDASLQCFSNLDGTFAPSNDDSFLFTAESIVFTLYAELADDKQGWRQSSTDFSPGDCFINRGGQFAAC